MDWTDLGSLLLIDGSFQSIENNLQSLRSASALGDSSYSRESPAGYPVFGWHPDSDKPGRHDNIVSELHGQLFKYIVTILSIPIAISVIQYSYNHVMAEQLNNILPVGLGYNWCECPLHLVLREILGLTFFG